MTRPLKALIHLERLKKNYQHLKELVGEGVELFPVIKANAYGHGAFQCARALKELGVKRFCVASLEEALELIEQGIDAEFILLSGVFPEEEPAVVRFGLIPCLSDLETARRLNQEALRQGRKARVHIKLDTGMGRLGFLPEEIGKVVEELAEMKGLELEGVLSHLSQADSSSQEAEEYSQKQIQDFSLLAEAVKKKISGLKYFHLAGSAGLIRYPRARFNSARPGIFLYGANPFYPETSPIMPEPVMSLVSEVALIKTLPAGSKISYRGKTTLKKTTRVAVVPVGYADGLPRSILPGFEFLVNGKPAPLLGVVTMDLIILDLSACPQAKPGDEVLLYGRENQAELRVEKLADSAGTISYELLVRVGRRAKKQFIDIDSEP